MLQECGKNMKIFSLLITQKFRNLSEYTYLYKIKVKTDHLGLTAARNVCGDKTTRNMCNE